MNKINSPLPGKSRYRLAGLRSMYDEPEELGQGLIQKVRLQEETRKAAKIMRSFANSHNNGLEKVIPQTVLQKAAGFAIFTVFKAGFLFSARAGSGVVIARLPDGRWSPPSAIGLGGFGFGGQLGAEVTDFLIVLNSRAAVQQFMAAGSVTLGGNLSVAVGPLGRNAEGSGSLSSKGKMAAMYSYSKTKGLFGGVSVEGSIIVERQDANRIAYGSSISAKQILNGTFDAPDWAAELTDEIDGCTGMPGGQRWRSWDEEGEGAGWGGRRPRASGAGVGAGGSGGDESQGGRRRGGSVGMFDRDREREGAGGGAPSSPSRPTHPKRASSFNPFSSSGGGVGSIGSPKRQNSAGMASSENYNAGLTWDSDGPMMSYGNRSRASSLMNRATGGEGGRARSYSDPKAQRRGMSYRKEEDLLGDLNEHESSGSNGYGNQRTGSPDLLGAWSADDKGLSASFAKMSTSTSTTAPGRPGQSRLRSSSKPPAPGFGDEEDAYEYVPHETSSVMAQRYSPAKMDRQQYGSRGAGAIHLDNDDDDDNDYLGSSRRNDVEDDPFGESDSTGRAFERYTSSGGYDSSSSARYKAAPAPHLTLKPGLSASHGPAETGYARAVALFDLPAGQPGDLGLKKGQVVYAMDKVGTGDWWRGMSVKGDEGIFPANYVEVLEIPRELRGGLTKGDLRKRVPDLGFD